MGYALEFHEGMIMGSLPEDTSIWDEGQFLADEIKDIIEDGVYDSVSPDFFSDWESEVGQGFTIVLALCKDGRAVNHLVIRLAAEDELDDWFDPADDEIFPG